MQPPGFMRFETRSSSRRGSRMKANTHRDQAASRGHFGKLALVEVELERLDLREARRTRVCSSASRKRA
jgi:hypothetical protein